MSKCTHSNSNPGDSYCDDCDDVPASVADEMARHGRVRAFWTTLTVEEKRMRRRLLNQSHDLEAALFRRYRAFKDIGNMAEAGRAFDAFQSAMIRTSRRSRLVYGE